MILFRVDARQTAIGFRQIAFVERQKSDEGTPLGDTLFFAANAANRGQIAEARSARIPSRAYWFEESDRTQPPSPPQENAAATDAPFAPWYEVYMNGPQTAW